MNRSAATEKLQIDEVLIAKGQGAAAPAVVRQARELLRDAVRAA